ncbi:adenosine receptor A3-like [Littorina saxatilis]|uniref:adenosine receptor A3-like n=1 Tax=Littorina saxatilis TaxID=31220 RepID=UPI0038B6A33F
MNASPTASNLLVNRTTTTAAVPGAYNSTEDNHHSISYYGIVVYLVFECLIGVASVCTNSMVLLAMLKERKLRTITNYFVGSLAAADVLVGIINIPVAILTTLGLPKNFTLCVLMNCIHVQVALISVLNLLSVALDRFCAIRVPFYYRNVMSAARARRLAGIMWLFAIFIGMIPLFGWNNGEHTFKYCSFDDVISLEYMVYLILFAVTLPSFVVMVLCYVYIFCVVRSTKKAIMQIMVLHGRERTMKTILDNFRGDKGILMVIFVFMICWMPFHVAHCLMLWGGSHSVPLGVYLVSIALSHCNSFVNPFLFAFGKSQFKVTIKSILCGASTTIESKGVRSEPHSVEADRPMPFVRHLLVLGVSITLSSNSSVSVALFEDVVEDIRQHPFSGPNRERMKTTAIYFQPNGTEILARDIREHPSSRLTPQLRPPPSPVMSLNTDSRSISRYQTSSSTKSLWQWLRIPKHPSSKPTQELKPTTSIASPPPLLNNTCRSTTIVAAVVSVPNDVENA